MRLYLKFLGIHVRSAMQYKSSFFATVFGQLLTSFSALLVIFFVTERYNEVGGFTYQQILLCASVVWAAFALSECFFRGFDMLPSMIGNGEFDRALLRPCNEIFLVLCSKLELTRLGRLIQAAMMLIYALPRCGVSWTLPRILVLVFMLLGGMAAFSGLFLIYAALSFFTLDGLEFMNIFTDGGREHGAYPFAVYGKPVLTLLTCIIPLACFQYWPLTWLLGQNNSLLCALAPAACFIFLIPCVLLWKFGLRHYKSTGS